MHANAKSGNGIPDSHSNEHGEGSDVAQRREITSTNSPAISTIVEEERLQTQGDRGRKDDLGTNAPENAATASTRGTEIRPHNLDEATRSELSVRETDNIPAVLIEQIDNDTKLHGSEQSNSENFQALEEGETEHNGKSEKPNDEHIDTHSAPETEGEKQGEPVPKVSRLLGPSLPSTKGVHTPEGINIKTSMNVLIEKHVEEIDAPPSQTEGTLKPETVDTETAIRASDELTGKAQQEYNISDSVVQDGSSNTGIAIDARTSVENLAKTQSSRDCVKTEQSIDDRDEAKPNSPHTVKMENPIEDGEKKQPTSHDSEKAGQDNLEQVQQNGSCRKTEQSNTDTVPTEHKSNENSKGYENVMTSSASGTLHDSAKSTGSGFLGKPVSTSNSIMELRFGFRPMQVNEEGKVQKAKCLFCAVFGTETERWPRVHVASSRTSDGISHSNLRRHLNIQHFHHWTAYNKLGPVAKKAFFNPENNPQARVQTSAPTHTTNLGQPGPLVSNAGSSVFVPYIGTHLPPNSFPQNQYYDSSQLVQQQYQPSSPYLHHQAAFPGQVPRLPFAPGVLPTQGSGNLGFGAFGYGGGQVPPLVLESSAAGQGAGQGLSGLWAPHQHTAMLAMQGQQLPTLPALVTDNTNRLQGTSADAVASSKRLLEVSMPSSFEPSIKVQRTNFQLLPTQHPIQTTQIQQSDPTTESAFSDRTALFGVGGGHPLFQNPSQSTGERRGDGQFNK